MGFRSRTSKLTAMAINTSRRIKSLEYHIVHLKLEIEDITEEMSSYSSDFFNSLVEASKVINENLQSTQSSQEKNHQLQDEISTIAAKDVESEDAKKLWKQIALLTHPDKTGNNARLTRLYKRAVEARKQSSVTELLIIAVELGINTSFSHELVIKSLEQTEKNLQTKLKDIENSVLIQWGRSKDEEEKKIIMDFYIKAKNKNL